MKDFLELSALSCANTGEREMTWSETIRDRAVAAEVTQDVFVWLIHHPDRFDPARGELSSFLLGVAAAGTR